LTDFPVGRSVIGQRSRTGTSRGAAHSGQTAPLCRRSYPHPRHNPRPYLREMQSHRIKYIELGTRIARTPNHPSGNAYSASRPEFHAGRENSAPGPALDGPTEAPKRSSTGNMPRFCGIPTVLVRQKICPCDTPPHRMPRAPSRRNEIETRNERPIAICMTRQQAMSRRNRTATRVDRPRYPG
jgi:hypothetical protein